MGVGLAEGRRTRRLIGRREHRRLSDEGQAEDVKKDTLVCSHVGVFDNVEGHVDVFFEDFRKPLRKGANEQSSTTLMVSTPIVPFE